MEELLKGFVPQDWKKIVRDVISSLSSDEREIEGNDGHWYQLRVRPYRTVDNRIDGAVLVFDDIEGIRPASDKLG